MRASSNAWRHSAVVYAIYYAGHKPGPLLILNWFVMLGRRGQILRLTIGEVVKELFIICEI
jgi:hypothetical protein